MSVCILCVQLRASLRTSGGHVQGQARWVFMHSRGVRKLKEFRSVNARAVVASRGIATLKLKLLITLVNQQSLLKYMTISLFNYIQFHCHSSSLQSTVRWKSEIRTRSTAFRMLHWPVCLQWRKKKSFWIQSSIWNWNVIATVWIPEWMWWALRWDLITHPGMSSSSWKAVISVCEITPTSVEIRGVVLWFVTSYWMTDAVFYFADSFISSAWYYARRCLRVGECVFACV